MNNNEPRPAGKIDDMGSEARTPSALCARGLMLRRAGQPLEAMQCCREALAIDENHAATLHLVGLLSFDAGQYDHAVEWFSRAIRQDPNAEYVSHLGAALQRLLRFDEALKAFDKAVQLKPDSAELWRNLGNVLVQLGRDDEALLSYRQAFGLDASDFDAASKAAALLHRQARWQESLLFLDACAALRPDHAVTLQLRAIAFRALRRFDAYLADSLRAHTLDPASADYRNNIGDALQSLGREGEALEWFEKALALLPDNIKILNNKAFLLGQFQRFGEAEAVFARIAAIEPDNAIAEWNLALMQMLRGDLASGWKGREARWRIPALAEHYPKFSQPMWLGREPVAGKTVLVHVDEGLGDCIQFARYVPDVAARGARVILVVADAVQPLLSELPGVAQCLPLSAGTLPPFDFHCPLSSLPLVFDARLDNLRTETCYLPPPAPARVQAWEHRLGPRDRLRVGLVWSGSLTHKNDHNRSIRLQAMAHILDVGASFVSLQKDPRPEDKAMLAARGDILDLTALLTDFAETAALVSCLDLVITVDTSVAHLAGAMGRPTWVLLPFTPDYRWLLGRDDSPWYPTLRLFRQDARRDYAPVLERVRAELAGLTSAPIPKFAPRSSRHRTRTSESKEH